jgi:hypothetical protein
MNAKSKDMASEKNNTPRIAREIEKPHISLP